MAIRYLDEQPTQQAQRKIRYVDEQPAAPQKQGLGDKLAQRAQKFAGAFTQPAADIYGEQPRSIVDATAIRGVRATGQVGGALGDLVGAGIGKSAQGYGELYKLTTTPEERQAIGDTGKNIVSRIANITLPLYNEKTGQRKQTRLGDLIKNTAGMVGESWQNFQSTLPKGSTEFYGDVLNSADLLPSSYAGRKVVQKAAPVIQGARTATGEAVENLGKSTLRSALKTKDVTAKMAGRNVEEGAQRLVDDIAKYKVQSTAKGAGGIAENAANKISAFKDEADNIIKTFADNNPYERISVDEVLDNFKNDILEGKIDNFGIFGKEETAADVVDGIKNALTKRGLAGSQTIDKIPEIKRIIKKGLGGFKKGAYNVAEDPTNKQVGELFYTRLKESLEGKIPEIKEKNKAIYDLLNVQTAALEAKKRIGNNNKIGLTDWIALLGGAPALSSVGVPEQFSVVAPAVAAGVIAKKAAAGGRGPSALITLGQAIKGNPQSAIADATNLVQFPKKASKQQPRTGKLGDMLRNESGEIGAYHGSPHSFDKFEMRPMTGEGAMAFGHGLYFTDEKDIAKHYASSLGKNEFNHSAKIKLTPKEVEIFNEEMKSSNPIYLVDNLRDAASRLEMGIESRRVTEDVRKKFKSEAAVYRSVADKIESSGIAPRDFRKELIKRDASIYTVTLHKGKTPDQYDYLKWDENLTQAQRDKIAKYAVENGAPKNMAYIRDDGKAVLNTSNHLTGEILYRDLSNYVFDSDKAASEFLLKAGIDGIDYPAGSLSGAANSKARNYVVFDPNAVTIESVEQGNTGLKMLGGMAGAGAAGTTIGAMANRKKQRNK